MTTIYFSVRDNRITLLSREAIVAENYNNYQFDFAFDEGWEDLAKVVTLKTGSSDAVEILYSGPFAMPYAAASVGGMKVSVSGYLGSNPMTAARTAVMAHDVPVLPAGLAPELPAEYTPSILEQILAAIGDLAVLDTQDKRSLVLAINETLADLAQAAADTLDAAKAYTDAAVDGVSEDAAAARQAAQEAAQSASAASASSEAAALSSSRAASSARGAALSANSAAQTLTRVRLFAAQAEQQASQARISANRASSSASAAEAAQEAAEDAQAAAEAAASTFETDTTLSIAGRAADAKATGDALAEAAGDRAELRTELLQTASAVTPLVLTADVIDDNPGTLLMPDGSTAATASAIGTSDAYACKTGQTLTYTLSTQAGRLVLAVYDAAGNLTHGVEGNGYSAYITGEYTFGANDAYFRVGGVTGGNYRKNYALSYSYGLPNAATKMDIEIAAEDRAAIRAETSRVSDALDTSGLSWNNLPDEYYSGDSYVNNGITFTKNTDNSVHSVGTATDQARYYWVYKYSMAPGTYTLGGIPDGADMQSFALQYAITEGTPGSADYKLILENTEITVPQGRFLSIRSWYKKGYVDEGHDWNVFLGTDIGALDSKANPKRFVPVIYENQKAINELRGHTLPSYWETYLQEKAADIRNAVYAVGNHGVVFQFFTDFHRPQSDVNYRGYTTLPQLLAYVKKHCFVDDVIFGGDVLQKNATAEEAAAVLEQYAQEFAELKPLNIVGNHDGNRYGGDPVGSALVDTGTLYSILFRGMEERVNLEPGMYWYRDNETQKVRVIALNTGTDALSEWNADAAQHRWLADTLAGTPEGYTLIVIPHVFFQMSGGALALSAIGSSVKAIVDAYASRSSGTWQGVSYDFTHAGGTVACILCGHAHNDGVIVSEAGYPMIGTVCEAMWGSQQTIARGTQAKQTTNEHAFDVVCLDTSSKTIKCVRVGSGADRTFSYS